MEVEMKLLQGTLILFLLLSCIGCTVGVREPGPKAAGKVAVCHKGKKTIYIDEAAVKAHLGHGDYMGPCR